MAVNPAGFVPVNDGGNPKAFTGYAFEAISGGQLVYVSGAADAVSSGLNSFATSDIGVVTGAINTLFNGIAMQNAASGTPVAVATRGRYIVRAAGAVVAGNPIVPNGSDAVVVAGSEQVGVVGRAVTGGSSGGFVIIDL